MSAQETEKGDKKQVDKTIETNEIQCTVISVPLVKDHLTFLLFKAL